MTLNELKQSFPDSDCEKILAIIESDDSNFVREISERADEFFRSCFHSPSFYLLKLYAIDELLETFGIEGFFTDDGFVDYCNTGDSYAATICFIEHKGFVIGSWADVMKEEEGI